MNPKTKKWTLILCFLIVFSFAVVASRHYQSNYIWNGESTDTGTDNGVTFNLYLEPSFNSTVEFDLSVFSQKNYNFSVQSGDHFIFGGKQQ